MDILGRMNNEAAALRSRMEVLSRQVASGRRAEVLGDLAPQAPRAVDLSNDIARRETYMRAIDRSAGRMEVMQSGLGRLKAIASEFRSEVGMRLSSRDQNALVTVQARARAALTEMGSLLNLRLNGEYLFGGSDMANPPVPDPQALANGPLANAIAAEVATLNNTNAAAVAANTRSLAQDTTAALSPFSTFLEDPAQGAGEPRRSMPVSDGEKLVFGIAANRNAMATSEGETTGGWARDLMRGLMTLMALTPAQLQQREGFEEFAQTIRTGLESAENALAEEMGALGAVQRQATSARTRHQDLSDAMQKQLVAITDVDLAATLTKLQGTRSALEASYRVTASLSDLSLARFLR
ncbi:MAG: flagellin [Alphaproteobacteria bacterium]|nr:flagellin [Alphaproteobacteria bacterium]